jgi:Mg/Co/Ni transporter MgtE
VGLLGALLAADIVGAYEQQLQANVMLAFFIPGIVYLADAVGTQTEALVKEQGGSRAADRINWAQRSIGRGNNR